MTIADNSDLVAGAMENVSRAHESTAQAHMAAMANVGQLDRVVTSGIDSIDRTLAQQQYYKNKATVNDTIGKASIAYIQAKGAIEGSHSLDEVQDVQQTLDNVYSGIPKAMRKAGLPPAMQQEVNEKLEYYKALNTSQYVKRTGQIGAHTAYTNFMNNGSAVAFGAGNDAPSVKSLLPVGHKLLDNPYLTSTQRGSVLKALTNWNTFTEFHVDSNNKPLQSGADPITNHAVSEANSIAGVKGFMKNLFMGNKPPLASIATNSSKINPDKVRDMLQQAQHAQDIFHDASVSGNLPKLMGDYSNSNDPTKQMLGNMYSTEIAKGRGEMAIRALCPSVKVAYNAMENVPDNMRMAATDNYNANLVNAAKNMGIPLSNVSSLPEDDLNAVTTIKTNYQDPQYAASLSSVLYKMDARQGNLPVFGKGDVSDTFRLYRAGDNNDPSFARFIGMDNPHVQSEVGSTYKASGQDAKLVTAFIHSNMQKLQTVATLTQRSLPSVMATFKAQVQQDEMSNDSTTESQHLLDYYTGDKKNDIGADNSYVLNKGVLADYDIPRDNAGAVVQNAMHLVLEKNKLASLNHYRKDNPDDKQSDASIRQTMGNKWGNVSNYTLSRANDQFTMINNSTGEHILMPDSAIYKAKDMYADQRDKVASERKQLFNNVWMLQNAWTGLL